MYRKGPAMHSWLIRTPEVVEPAHRNELHRDSRDTTHPVRETGEPAAPPGRQILPPQRFPGTSACNAIFQDGHNHAKTEG